MGKDAIKRNDSDRRVAERRQAQVPVNDDRRKTMDRRSGVDRRLERKD